MELYTKLDDNNHLLEAEVVCSQCRIRDIMKWKPDTLESEQTNWHVIHIPLDPTTMGHVVFCNDCWPGNDNLAADIFFNNPDSSVMVWE